MLKRSLTDEKRAEVLMRLNENIQRAGHLENVFGNVHNILDSYELEFTRKTGLTKIDWGFLFVATAMQICRQYLLTSFADRINDQDAAKRVKGGKKEHSDRSHRYYQPSLNEIITNPVPFDANVGSNGALTGGGYFGHRGRTLGHDPLLGLVFGTANIATSTLTTTTFESYHITTGARKNGGTQDVFGNHADTFKVLMRTYDKIANEGMDGRAKVSASLVKEVVHLKSDIGSIKGLPLPIVEVFSADLASDLAKWGFDSTNLVTVGKQVAFSVLINQLISLVAQTEEAALSHPDGVACHLRRIGEEEEHTGCDGGVEDIHTGATENLLTENDTESAGQSQHPQRTANGDDQRNDDTRYEVTLLNLLALPLGPGKLDTQTDDIADENLGQYSQEAIEEDLEKTSTCEGARSEIVLIADIVHTEQHGWHQSDDHHTHNALRVDGIVNVHATSLRRVVGHVKEGLKAVEHRAEGM